MTFITSSRLFHLTPSYPALVSSFQAGQPSMAQYVSSALPSTSIHSWHGGCCHTLQPHYRASELSMLDLDDYGEELDGPPAYSPVSCLLPYMRIVLAHARLTRPPPCLRRSLTRPHTPSSQNVCSPTRMFMRGYMQPDIVGSSGWGLLRRCVLLARHRLLTDPTYASHVRSRDILRRYFPS